MSSKLVAISCWLCVFSSVAVLPGQPQRRRMPDSATGRMAGALLELADASAEELVSFLNDRVAPEALDAVADRLRRYRDTLEAPELQRAEKTGAFSAVVTLASAGVTYRASYGLESVEPHRLTSFDFSEGGSGSAASLPALGDRAGRKPPEVTTDYFESLVARDVFSGSVLVAKGRDVVFESAFGLAERDSKLPNRTDTLFDVGSITKLMTKVAIGQLARDGKLSMDDTVASHLDDYPNLDVASRVTVGQLVEHRSGLGDIFNARFERTPKDQLIAPSDYFLLFADEPLQFEPGRSESYSNAGYVVLGAIIEAASGMSYFDYIDRYVFAPSGIEGEGFVMRSKTATGYTGRGGALHSNRGMLPLRGCPAGSSSHSARGLYRFERALSSGKLLGPEWTRWFHGGDADEVREPAFSFGGGGPGVNAMLVSEDGMTYVVLANLDPPAAQDAIDRLTEIWTNG